MAEQEPMTFDPVEAADEAGRDLGIYKRRGVEGHMTGEAPPPPDENYLRAQSPELMVKQVEDRIARYQRELSEVSRFDPATGQPVPVITGTRRTAMERELVTLQHSTLPYTKAQAAEIARLKAALPTADDKLRAEGERRDRIDARALEIAEEQEAKAKAERILRARQTSGNPG